VAPFLSDSSFFGSSSIDVNPQCWWKQEICG
jgi:hypothetical protein